MITLLGSLLGFLGSLVPDIFKFFQDKQDHTHELALFDRQMHLLRYKHLSRLREAEIIEDAAESKSLYVHARATGVKWVDALSGTVRPIITYTFFLLYAIVKGAHLSILLNLPQGISWPQALLSVWHEEDQALFAAVMAFWFGHRALRKTREVR